MRARSVSLSLQLGPGVLRELNDRGEKRWRGQISEGLLCYTGKMGFYLVVMAGLSTVRMWAYWCSEAVTPAAGWRVGWWAGGRIRQNSRQTMCAGSKHNSLSSTSDFVTSRNHRYIHIIFFRLLQTSLNTVYAYRFLKIIAIIRPAANLLFNSNEKAYMLHNIYFLTF